MNRETLANKIVTEAQALMNIIDRYENFYQRTTHFKIYQACNSLGFKLCNYADLRTVLEKPDFMLAHDHISDTMIEDAFQVLPGLSADDVVRDKAIVKEGLKVIVEDVKRLITMPVITATTTTTRNGSTLITVTAAQPTINPIAVTQSTINPALVQPLIAQARVTLNAKEELHNKISANLGVMMEIVNRYYEFYSRTKFHNTCSACAELRRSLLVYSNRRFWSTDTKALAYLLTQSPITSETVNKAFAKAPGLLEADVIRDKLAMKEGLQQLYKDALTLMEM